jgi:PPOX class probable F420-dependent enzyme
MDLERALEFARQNHNGVLATIKRDGRPQISNITYLASGDGVIRISITAGRAKFANLTRDARASLHVSQPDFWGYVVLEADAELAPVASAPDDATVEELVSLYRGVQGEHPDWNEYRAVMVRDRRTVVRLRPNHVYGMLNG